MVLNDAGNIGLSLNGRSVIVVVLKSTTPNVWKDSSKLLAWALERPASGS